MYFEVRSGEDGRLMKSCTDDRTPAASAEDQACKGRWGAIIAFYVGPTSLIQYSYVFDCIFLRLRLHIPTTSSTSYLTDLTSFLVRLRLHVPMASTAFSYGFPSMFLRLRPHVVFHIPLSGRGNIAGEYVYSSWCVRLFILVSTSILPACRRR